ASVSSAGVEADDASQFPTLSKDGRLVAFDSSASNLVAGDTNNATDVFVRDRKAQTTTRVSVATDGSQTGAATSASASISASGRIVSFSSDATNLAAGDVNGKRDVFVRDRKKSTTTRVSVASDGTEAAGGDSDLSSVSGNGKLVGFRSTATN